MEKNSTELIILQKATEEFLAKGYDGARTTSIAKAAGVTHAMLHYYYRSKEQLFEKILETKIGEFANAIIKGLSPDNAPSMTKKIELITGMYFDYISQDPHLPIFMLTEVLPVAERRAMMQAKMMGFVKELFGRLTEEFKQAIANGEIAEMNLSDLFIDIISLNLFSISSSQVATSIFNIDRESYLRHRRKENIQVILKRIAPTVPPSPPQETTSQQVAQSAETKEPQETTSQQVAQPSETKEIQETTSQQVAQPSETKEVQETTTQQVAQPSETKEIKETTSQQVAQPSGTPLELDLFSASNVDLYGNTLTNDLPHQEDDSSH